MEVLLQYVQPSYHQVVRDVSPGEPCRQSVHHLGRPDQLLHGAHEEDPADCRVDGLSKGEQLVMVGH